MTLTGSCARAAWAVALVSAAVGRGEAQVPSDLLFKDGLECAVLPLSSAGCEFYAVPLANTLDAPGQPFAVVLHNTMEFETATVSVTGGALIGPVALAVSPGDAETLSLPWVDDLQTTSASSRVDGGAYHIVSDRPLAVHQFNSLGSGLDFFSCDASLLLPVHALGRNYHAVTWPSWESHPGYFAVVGVEDGTGVSIATPTGVLAGGGVSGQAGAVTLDRGDVLQVLAPAPGAGNLAYGADLTGSTVSADKAVAVFGGHDGTFIPAGSGFADHLEEQIAPDETLGTEFVVAVPARSIGTWRHLVRVTGAEPGTALAYTPPLAGAPSTLAAAGESVTFVATVDFRMVANKPMTVSQFLEGSGVTGSGDPSMGIVVPSPQFRTAYTFAIPLFNEAWITVVGPASATVSVDGSPLGLSPIPGTSDGVGRVDAGLSFSDVHHVTATAPVGVYVHGFADYASYLAPAGRGLSGVPPETGRIRPWSSVATDAGDLSVTPAAAMNGTSHGLQALVDDTAGLFVQDDTPDGEGRYRTRFYFDPNGFDPGEAQNHFRTRIFIAFDDVPVRRLAAIVLRRLGGAYSLMARARLDDNSQANTPFVPISDGPHVVEVAWTRSSGAAALDGSVEMRIDGGPPVTRGGLDNSLGGVDFVRLGALSVKMGAAGTMYWDEFESRRSSYIGP